jgi:hypothetical protein
MFKLFFETANAAFEFEGASETARILRDLAERIEQGEILDYAKIRDINGNSIGEVQTTSPEPA